MTTPRIDEVATEFLRYLDDTVPVPLRDPNYNGPCEAINPDSVEAIAAGLLDLIANVVATIIDAGSERDAVNENEALLKAIAEELWGWTGD